jgi:hypothetical protein
MIQFCYLSSLVESKFLERVRIGVVGKLEIGRGIDVRREFRFRIIRFRHGNGGGVV